MAEPIADDPASWSWPEDVRERLDAKRRGIEAARQQAEAEAAATQPGIWSDWLRRLRATGEATEDLNISDYIGL